MRPLAPVSAIIFLALGALCLALAAREQQCRQAQDPLGRSTAATNRRQLELCGRTLFLLGGANLLSTLLA